MKADSKWRCIKCDTPIPYNPEYDMSHILCAQCACYENADKLLNGYRMPVKK